MVVLEVTHGDGVRVRDSKVSFFFIASCSSHAVCRREILALSFFPS